MEGSATASSSAAASSSHSPDKAGRLQALQAQIAARKRRREEEQENQQQQSGDHDNSAVRYHEGPPTTGSIDIKGKRRAVSFTGSGMPGDVAAATAEDWDQTTMVKSILKGSKPAGTQGQTATAASTKEKTKAKQKYLKRKLERRKAKKRNEKTTSSSSTTVGSKADGNRDEDDRDTGDASMATEADRSIAVSTETPEQRLARKRAIREARRAQKPPQSGEQATETSKVVAEQPIVTQAVSVEQDTPASTSDKATDKEERRRQRAARKEAKRAKSDGDKVNVDTSMEGNTHAADLPATPEQAGSLLVSEAPMVPAAVHDPPGTVHGQQDDEEEPSRRELAMQAKVEEMRHKQAMQNKKARKQALKEAKARGLKASIPVSMAEIQALLKETPTTTGEEPTILSEDTEPTHKDALPRFPAPSRPAAPSQKELDALAISHELKDAIVVDQAASTPVKEFTQASPDNALSDSTLHKLEQISIDKFFAVQAAVLPILLKEKALYTPRGPPRDVCVSAPTGSGKTLSYVIPIVEILSPRIITRLRALIVLPTRDLVAQVRDVFEQFTKGTGLTVGAITGQHSFAHEQHALIDDMETRLLGGSSKVDILIATPGRLMDHLRSTPNFTLQHLRFLVIDEADRLLNQSFNDWLRTIVDNIQRPKSSLLQQDVDANDALEPSQDSQLPHRGDAVAPALMDACYSRAPSDLDMPTGPSTQKLLFSATLTRDPARVAALQLNKPIYLAVTSKRGKSSTAANEQIEGSEAIEDGEGDTLHKLLDDERQFVLPETLREHMIVTAPYQKPLALLHLLCNVNIRHVLCFTKSVESAGRLALLLETVGKALPAMIDGNPSSEAVSVSVYSSELAAAARKSVLARFAAGEINVLVCSDLIARGMDVSTIEHVVNYDVPVDMRKYVHRVGRTARAGREGNAWNLVETQEASFFKKLMRSGGRYEQIKKVRVGSGQLDRFADPYETALESLRSRTQ